MRIDKFLSHSGYGSRKEVRDLLKQKKVLHNGKLVKSAKLKVNIEKDVVTVNGEQVMYQAFYYYMLHKPQGVISATSDNQHQTVMNLFDRETYREDLFPVGRLDKDTEGLLLITNDGVLAHELLSPKHKVPKVYQARISGLVTEKEVARFSSGMTLRSGEEFAPATLKIQSTDEEKQISEVEVTITEGKFHQVKRMFQGVEMKVLYLKRLSMGSLHLDETLPIGAFRELTELELNQLKDEKQ